MSRSSTKYCGNQTDKNVEFLLKISIKPHVAIIVLIADDVVVKRRLPQFLNTNHMFTITSWKRFKRTDDTHDRRAGGLLPPERLMSWSREYDWAWSHNVQSSNKDNDLIDSTNHAQRFYQDLTESFRREQAPALPWYYSTGASFLCTNRDKKFCVNTVIKTLQSRMLPLW